MVVLFALLVLAVVVGGIVVALRYPRAGAAPEPTVDAAVGAVPAGPLSAADVRSVRFPLAFRGYRTADVDALLARLEEQLGDQGPEPGQPGTGQRVAEQPGPVSPETRHPAQP